MTQSILINNKNKLYVKDDYITAKDYFLNVAYFKTSLVVNVSEHRIQK
jgi:hypothetical protein